MTSPVEECRPVKWSTHWRNRSIRRAGHSVYVANFATMHTHSALWPCVRVCVLVIPQPSLPPPTLCLPSSAALDTKDLQSSDQLPPKPPISSIGEKSVLAARYNCCYIHILYGLLYTYEYWPVVITALCAHYTQHLERLTYSPWLLLTFDPLGICYATDFQRIFCKSTKFRGTRIDSTYALIPGPDKCFTKSRVSDICISLQLWCRRIWRMEISNIHHGALSPPVPRFRFALSWVEPFPKSAIALTAK